MARLGSGGETAPAESQQRPSDSGGEGGGSSGGSRSDPDPVSDEEAVRRRKDQLNADRTGADTGVVDDDDSSDGGGGGGRGGGRGGGSTDDGSRDKGSDIDNAREQDRRVVGRIKDRINRGVRSARSRVRDANVRDTASVARQTLSDVASAAGAYGGVAGGLDVQQGVEADESSPYADQARDFERDVLDQTGLSDPDNVAISVNEEAGTLEATLTEQGTREARERERERRRLQRQQEQQMADELGVGDESDQEAASVSVPVNAATPRGIAEQEEFNREARRSQAQEEQFGDFAIENPVTGNRIEDELRDVSEGYQDSVRDYLDTAVGSDLNPLTGQLQREAVQAGLRATGQDDLAAEIERQEQVSDQFLESFNVGAASLGDIAGTAAGVKEGVELGGFVSEQAYRDLETSVTEQQLSGDNLGETGDELGAAGSVAVSEFTDNARSNPVEVGGQLAGSLVGSTAAFRTAAAIGPRTSAATRYAIQPGEEVVTGLASRAAPGTARALGGTIDIEEAAIVGGRRATSRVRSAVDRGDFDTRLRQELTGTSRGQADLAFGGLETETETRSGGLESEIQEELDRMERAQRGEFLDAGGQSGLDTETNERIGETRGPPSGRYSPSNDFGTAPSDDLRRVASVEDALRGDSRVGGAVGRRTRAEASSFQDDDAFAGSFEDTSFDASSFAGGDTRTATRARDQTQSDIRVDQMFETGLETDVTTDTRMRTAVDTASDIETDIETEFAQEFGLESETETELESAFELEAEAAREGSLPFEERPEQERRQSFGFDIDEKLFSSGIADAEDLLR